MNNLGACTDGGADDGDGGPTTSDMQTVYENSVAPHITTTLGPVLFKQGSANVNEYVMHVNDDTDITQFYVNGDGFTLTGGVGVKDDFPKIIMQDETGLLNDAFHSLEFYDQNNTEMSRIQCTDGDIAIIANTPDGDVILHPIQGFIKPGADGVDLGSSNNKFNDLHLSGGVQLYQTPASINKYDLKAPAGLPSDISFTFPPTAGNVGDTIYTDGSGNHSYGPPSTAGIPGSWITPTLNTRYESVPNERTLQYRDGGNGTTEVVGVIKLKIGNSLPIGSSDSLFQVPIDFIPPIGGSLNFNVCSTERSSYQNWVGTWVRIDNLGFVTITNGSGFVVTVNYDLNISFSFPIFN